MIKLNKYITEAWSGVKKHTNNANIEAWCDKIGIKKYNINDEGKIDVEGNVNLNKSNFKELPYKFGNVSGWFDLSECKNLISLKNCPDKVGLYFSCSDCAQLDSLEGCPKKVGSSFYCYGCKIKFTEEEVRSLCKVKVDAVV